MTKKFIRISVILATYEGDNFEYLKLAIESILNQSYANTEIIIVCDGPIDSKSSNYLKSLPKNTSILNLEVNSGPAFARNAGIEAATGDYIAIMDADDIALPNRLVEQLDFLLKNNLDLVSGDLTVIDSSGRIIGIRKVPYSHDEVLRLAPLRCPMHNPVAFGDAKLFKKLKYNEYLRVSEDYDLWIRALLAGYRLGNISKPLVKYRQGKGDFKKRIGFKYALSDLFVKKSALRLCSGYHVPYYFVIAIFVSIVRMVPAPVFKLIYRLRFSSIVHPPSS